MSEAAIDKNTFDSFKEFLAYIVQSSDYEGFIEDLRKEPVDKFYDRDMWHSVGNILKEKYPVASEVLHNFGFDGWDESISFSPGNLKAAYIIDEDFVNDGRAFVLFNLVASNWSYVVTVDNQARFWGIKD